MIGIEEDMKITAIEEYGLRVALQFAREASGGPLTISEIAEREGLSSAYVAKLLAMLRQSGIVTSARGRLGGYSLARPAAETSVAEILRVFGGQVIDAGHCERHAGTLEVCIHAGNCTVRSLWGALETLVDRLLGTVTLADLVAGRLPRGERIPAGGDGIALARAESARGNPD